jgi:DNA repair protein RadC
LKTIKKQKVMKAKKFDLKATDSEFTKVKITTSESAEKFIRQFYGDDLEIFESFFILLLNRANETIGYAKISQGGIVGTVVDKKILLKYVVESLASGIILAHNHPSGNANPSQADLNITKDLQQLCNLVDSTVLDHVILTADSFYSFADNGKL